MQQHPPSIFADTAIAIQTPDDPDRLTLYVWGGLSHPSSNARKVMTVPLPREVTALTMMPHGISWCDRSGRVHLHRLDLLDLNPCGEGAVSDSSFWSGSVVRSLNWIDTDHIVTGDTHGRLLGWQLDVSKSMPCNQPSLIASATGDWLDILPIDGDQVIATAADGQLLWLDSSGQMTRTVFLPLPNMHVGSVMACPSAHLLIYDVVPPSDGGGSIRRHIIDSTHGWLAWDLKQNQPYPLPDVVRYADTLTVTPDAVLVMNPQGMSWRWVVGDVTPTPLAGWPAGPCQRLRVIDTHPTVMRLGAGGELDLLRLEGNTWHSVPSPIPTTTVTRLWASGSGVFTVERQARLRQLQQLALKAHADGDTRNRDGLLEQIEQTDEPGARAQALRAKFADDEGDPVAALTHCRQVITSSNGSTPAVWLALYARLLWQTAALDDLSTQGEHARSVVGSLLPECTHLLLEENLDPLMDVWDPQAAEDCPWSTLAWARVKRCGTGGPFWLGAERERPYHLREENRSLLGDAITACGGLSIELAVLSPRGVLLTTNGWVFTETIPTTAMQRQLVIWLQPGAGIQLESRWAVRADQAASKVAWASAWEAVQDPNWRSACRRYLDIALEAVACRVMPDASLLRTTPINNRVAIPVKGHLRATTTQEAMT